MLYLLIAVSFSFVLCLFFIKVAKEKYSHFLDTIDGPQKFHKGNVPRIGGLTVYLALLAVGFLFFIEKPFALEYLLLMLSSVPVFAGGFLDDVKIKISPRTRLLFASISALLVIFLFDARVISSDLPHVDSIFKFYFVSLVFTVFALVGISNAFNIIDGYNGLTSGVAIVIFGSYAYVSYLQGDLFLLYLSLTVVAGVLGFFVWNYPGGNIFLGDGGAYLLGFLSGITGILLVKKHSQVSPWFVFLLLLYPTWETIFSIYRRKTRGKSPFKPDSYHFHTLLYKRLLRWTHDGNEDLNPNSMTSPYLWILQLICTVPALIFWKNTPVLVAFSLIIITGYCLIYRRLAKYS